MYSALIGEFIFCNFGKNVFYMRICNKIIVIKNNLFFSDFILDALLVSDIGFNFPCTAKVAFSEASSRCVDYLIVYIY